MEEESLNPWGNNCTICQAPTFSATDWVCHRHSGEPQLPEVRIHIAGPCGRHRDRVRQRCYWCGDTLLTYRPSMVEEWDRPKSWAVDSWVAMSNGAGWSVDPTDETPDNACFREIAVDTSDFDRYCAEHRVPLGKEPEAFEEWLQEIVGLATRHDDG